MDPYDHPLTWEYLYKSLERTIKWGEETCKTYPAIMAFARFLDIHRRLYDILPALQNHPVMGKHIPCLGASEFHWWPAEDYWISLNTMMDTIHYSIRLGYQKKVEVHTLVFSAEVIPTLLDYMSRANSTSS